MENLSKLLAEDNVNDCIDIRNDDFTIIIDISTAHGCSVDTPA